MRIEKTHITLKLIKSISPGESIRYCDTELMGFQAWVGAKSITFYLRRRSGGREYTVRLGRWPDITVDEARKKALDRLGALANHGSIESPAGRENPIVEDAVNYYISIQNTDLKKHERKRDLMHYAGIFGKRIRDLQKEDIEEVMKSMKDTPAGANRAYYSFIAAVHKFCRKSGIQYTNFTDGIKLYDQKPRERYITKDEAPRFFEALEKTRENPHYSMMCDVILMLLYTGARKSNVCEMRIEEIKGDSWTIPAGKFKGGKKSPTIRLGNSELEIIAKYSEGRKSGYVFPHSHPLLNRLRFAKNRICEIAGMKDFRVHDFRRTLGTWMLSSGSPIAVVSKKLCHSSIVITERVYAHVMPEVSVEATDAAINALKNAGKANE